MSARKYASRTFQYLALELFFVGKGILWFWSCSLSLNFARLRDLLWSLTPMMIYSRQCEGEDDWLFDWLSYSQPWTAAWLFSLDLELAILMALITIIAMLIIILFLFRYLSLIVFEKVRETSNRVLNSIRPYEPTLGGACIFFFRGFSNSEFIDGYAFWKFWLAFAQIFHHKLW